LDEKLKYYHLEVIKAMSHFEEEINGYFVASEKSTSGQSYWFFAFNKDSKTPSFFLKAFLTPKEPTKESLGDKKYKKEMKKRFHHFLTHQNTLLNLTSVKNENLLVPIEQFVHKGTFIKVFKKYTEKKITAKEISKYNIVNKINIFQCISNALFSLHRLNIVHSDIKLENILFSEERNNNAPLLIDYDGAFFSGRANEIETIFFDQPYASPEMFQYTEDKKVDRLTKSTDIFSLGVLFHELWYGDKPKFNSMYESCGHSVLNLEKLSINMKNDFISKLIISMLNLDYKKRPDIENIISALESLRGSTEKSKLHISLSFIEKIVKYGFLKMNMGSNNAPTEDIPIKKLATKHRRIGKDVKLKTTIKK